MRSQELEVIFSLHSIDSVRVWNLIYKFLEEKGLPKEITLNGTENVSPNSIETILLKEDKLYFNIQFDSFVFRFSTVSNYKHHFLSIEVKDSSSINWDEWVTLFLTLEGFVQAWVSDKEYYYWQNVEDIMAYETVGKSYSNLPLKQSGLPR